MQIVGLITSVSCSIARYNDKKIDLKFFKNDVLAFTGYKLVPLPSNCSLGCEVMFASEAGVYPLLLLPRGNACVVLSHTVTMSCRIREGTLW